MKQLTLLSLLTLISMPAFAYVGPGLGMGVIGTIFGVLAAIVLAVFGLFWYPLKRALKKKKAGAEHSQSAASGTVQKRSHSFDVNNPTSSDNSPAESSHGVAHETTLSTGNFKQNNHSSEPEATTDSSVTSRPNSPV